MKLKEIGDKLLFGGGIIPEQDSQKLRKMGVGRLFAPGTTSQDIVEYINASLGE
jgi:methylmalonyl-CoA mutase C-terminal domain/subunit